MSPTTERYETDERILLVIHDAVQQYGDALYTIGDIILTDRCFYFLQYYQITNPLTLFGLVGGIISIINENERIASLRKDADLKRRSLYGLGLKKRAALKILDFKSIIFSPTDVKELHAWNETRISLDAQDKKQYHYLVPKMSAAYQEAVNNWPNSAELYDRSSDPDGFFAGSSSPRELLLRVANGDAAAASEIYQLGLKENYAVILFANLIHLNENERTKVLERFSSGPLEFRNDMLARAEKIARDSKKNRIIGFVLLLVFGFFGAIAISSLSIGTGIAAIIGIVLGLSGVINSSHGLQTANEVRTHLEGNS